MTIDLQDRTHTIQRGDTFRSLAQRFYDNADRWLLIREENARSRRLQALPPPGQSITLPGADTLWRRMDQAISQFRDNFQVYAPFVGADRVDVPDPFLLPPRPDRSQGRAEINIDFFGLVQVIDDRTLPAVENDDFKITWVPNEPERVGFANEIKLGLTVKAKNVWKGALTARKALAASFEDLLTRLEDLEVKQERLIFGAAEHIRRRLAQTLPATFEESLSLRYGLNLGYGADNSPYVDLLPGMTLRLDQTMRQFVGPGSIANGLVNAGAVNFTIDRDADGRISFDPFLSAISSPQSGRRAGVFRFVGGFDLQAAGTTRRHARLFFPTQLPDPAQPSGDPAVQLGRHVAIVLADTLPDLAR
ncbi:MAG: hypothetical protein KDD84_03185, partial [Caldilineaceae bacterium]|nr:hypothetical protein [Caldilineaceae bacterium]